MITCSKCLMNDFNDSEIVFDNNNINKIDFEKYVSLHEKSAGFKTRSNKSFDAQYNAIKKDLATMIFTEYKNKIININFYYHKNYFVNYSSNAEDYNSNDIKFSPNHSSIFF